MNTEIRNDFRLHFMTDSSQTKSINVPRANTTLEDEAVADAMSAIIDSNAVLSPTRGAPALRVGAERVTTQTTGFDIFAA